MPKVTKKLIKKPTSKLKVAKKTNSAPKNTPVQSFRLSRNTPTFMTRRITEQTLYWVILMVVIVGFQLWILKLQIDIINSLQSLAI